MINRRNFVGGAALAAALAQARAARSHDTASLSLARLPLVIVDERHPESRAFAMSLARRGAALLPLADGDVTAVWLGELSRAWQAGPVAVAGLTRPPALFVLEQLALSHGLRVVMHAEHTIGAGDVRHQVLGCAAGASPPDPRELQLLGAAWPSGMAALVASWSGLPRASDVGTSCAGLAPAPVEGTALLASWIIAPVSTSRS